MATSINFDRLWETNPLSRSRKQERHSFNITCSIGCVNYIFNSLLTFIQLPADVLRHITERFDEAQFDKNLGAAIKKILPDQSKKVSEIEGTYYRLNYMQL